MFPFDLLKRSSSPSGSPGKRAYAIGDIHGCFDLLLDLVAQIEDDNARRAPKELALVFLGDLIDRGPSSRSVVQFLRDELSVRHTCHFIAGNHEEILVRALSGETQLIRPWLQQGGLACAESYGVQSRELRDLDEFELREVLLSAIPSDDIQFMSGFHDYVRFGDYLFVHAGIRPGIPFEHQTPQDMRWIREPFLRSRIDHGLVVVHGHTISREVDTCANRIGLDTGAYRSGVLSALMIDGQTRHILQTCSADVSEPAV